MSPDETLAAVSVILKATEAQVRLVSNEVSKSLEVVLDDGRKAFWGIWGPDGDTHWVVSILDHEGTLNASDTTIPGTTEPEKMAVTITEYDYL